jgi:mono/diheme cytochrome c family protein
MKRLSLYVFGTLILASSVAWVLTEPRRIDANELAGLSPDLERGAYVYTAAGCASCHAGETGEGDTLSGGMEFPSDFGTFYAPNISPDKTHGIGEWSVYDLANAILHGTSPEGTHYYPAFPYNSYANVQLSDVVSLHAYMQTLPMSDTPSKSHDLGFPLNMRRSVGGWKLLFGQSAGSWQVTDPNMSKADVKGQYLVEALAHCSECHTPRNALGAMDMSRFLGGAPNPSGNGTVPNITPGTLTWSMQEIAEYLDSGFTPDFDSAGGHMAHVVENFAKLEQSDRDAVASYLKRVAPVE